MKCVACDTEYESVDCPYCAEILERFELTTTQDLLTALWHRFDNLLLATYEDTSDTEYAVFVRWKGDAIRTMGLANLAQAKLNKHIHNTLLKDF